MLASQFAKLRTLHISYALGQDEITTGPLPTKEQLLFIAGQLKPTVTQFGVQTRVWQVRPHSCSHSTEFYLAPLTRRGTDRESTRPARRWLIRHRGPTWLIREHGHPGGVPRCENVDIASIIQSPLWRGFKCCISCIPYNILLVEAMSAHYRTCSYCYVVSGPDWTRVNAPALPIV